MSEIIELFKNKKVLISTIAGLLIGGVLGVLAYYNDWLG